MRSRIHDPMLGAVVGATCACWGLLSACALVAPPVPPDLRSHIVSRRGDLVEVQETPAGPGRFELRLRSTSGLEFAARLTLPPNVGAGERLPAAVLTAGYEAGRAAVDEIPADTRAVSVSPDFPDLGGTRVGDEVSASRIAERSLEHVARILLVGEYLLGRDDVDPERVSLIGVSFGGFYAPAAAALEPRFRNVAVMYAGGDVAAIVGRQVERLSSPPAGILAGDVIALFLHPIEPLRWVEAIAPRPILFVNGSFDDRVPRSSAERLHAAATGPRDIVWLPTGHLEPGDAALVRELVDTAFARLPVLASAR
jgi:pimeloyl-ACP methyl ester carboxylesterase